MHNIHVYLTQMLDLHNNQIWPCLIIDSDQIIMQEWFLYDSCVNDIIQKKNECEIW